MGVAPVPRGERRLKVQAALLLASVGLAGCAPPMQSDPVAAYHLAIELPNRLPEEFKGGSFSSDAHDVWLCFRTFLPVKLRDADRFGAADPELFAPAFKAVCPDPLLDTPGRLRVMHMTEGGRPYDIGKVMLYEPMAGRYFVRSWRRPLPTTSEDE